MRQQTNIGSDNGLSPGRCRAIIRTNAGILLTGPLGNLYIIIQENAFENTVCKMAAILPRPQCVNKTRHSRMNDGCRGFGDIFARFVRTCWALLTQ